MNPDVSRRPSGVNTSTNSVASGRDDRVRETEQARRAAREITPLPPLPLTHTPGERERESPAFASGVVHRRHLEWDTG
jgi:hypothetical protein